MITQPQPLIVLRTSWMMHGMLSGLWGASFVIALATAIWIDPTAWAGVLMAGAGFAVTLLWLLRAKVTLTNCAIHHRSLFATKCFPIRNIIKAKFNYSPDSIKSTQWLEIFWKRNKKEKQSTIKLDLFNLREVNKLVEILNSIVQIENREISKE